MAGLLLDVRLVGVAQLLELVGVDVQVFFDAEFFLQVVEDVLEVVLGEMVGRRRVGDIREHHQEAAIAVVDEARVVGRA